MVSNADSAGSIVSNADSAGSIVSNADSAGFIVANANSAGFILQVFTRPGCSRLLSLVSLSSCTVSLLCGVMYLRKY